MVSVFAEREARVAEMRRQQLLRDAEQRRFVSAYSSEPSPKNLLATRRERAWAWLRSAVGLLAPAGSTRSAAIGGESAAPGP